MQGEADRLEVLIYTRAFTVAARIDLPGSYGAGWNPVPVALPELPNGLYFTQVRAFQGGSGSGLPRPGTLMLLR